MTRSEYLDLIIRHSGGPLNEAMTALGEARGDADRAAVAIANIRLFAAAFLTDLNTGGAPPDAEFPDRLLRDALDRYFRACDRGLIAARESDPAGLSQAAGAMDAATSIRVRAATMIRHLPA